MWLNVLWRRWFGRTRPFPSHLRRRRTVRRRPCIGPRLELLEERTLLSAPGDVLLGGSGNVSVPASSQGGQVSGTYFLGSNFDTGNQSIGGVTGSDPFAFGAKLNLNLKGKVGLDLAYSASSGGQVAASYQGVNLQQHFADPTQFNQEVNFTPQNTNVSSKSGSFSTSGPSVSASAGLDASVGGSVGGTIAVFKSYSNSVNFNASVNQPLINIGIGSDTKSNDLGLQLGLLGQDLSNQLSTVAGVPTLSLKVNPAGPEVPIYIQGDLSGSTNPFAAHEGFQVGAGEGEGDQAVGGSVVLGSADEFAPDISLSSNSLQDGDVLSASGQGTIADLNIQMGPVVGTLLSALGFLPGSALLAADTDTISVGPASLIFTPVSFQMGPTLSLAQSGSVTPTNTLTYNFYTNSTETTPLSVDVTENGKDLGQVSSVMFTPGKDNVGIQFTGAPITVQPTWNYALNYTDELDLDASLQGTLTAGELAVGYGPLVSPPLGPLYQQTFDLADTKLATIYDNTSTLFSSTTKLATFTIGDTFKPSLVVTTTADGNTTFNPGLGTPGTLRGAVESANLNAQGGNTAGTQIIQLGAGTYNLTIPQSGSNNGSSGGLYVTAPNLIIEGAGAGQTIINASSGLGDRAFNIASGANLTLQGVTIQGGNTATNGGGIYNAGKLKISDSTISGNSASEFGGGIDNEGALKIEDSTVTDNTASEAGGGIYNDGTLTIDDSTLSDNTAKTNGGGINNGVGRLMVEDSTISGNTASFEGGGGVFNGQFATATIGNSTIAGNTATPNPITVAGGGVYNSGVITIGNSTISANNTAFNVLNSVGGDGGGIFTPSPSFRPNMVTDLYNTIVAGNSAAISFNTTTSNDIDGTVSSTSAYNLIGDGAGLSGISNGSSGNLIGAHSAPLNPKLASLGNYGGPTQTMALLLGSPAIDAGSSNVPGGLPPTDQRGYSRTVGANVDIGAVEYQYDLNLTGSLVAGSAPNTVQYAYTVTNNGPDPAPGATLTVPLPQGVAFQSLTLPAGWTETDPGAGNNGIVAFTYLGNLNSGQSASFTITAQVQGSAVGTSLATTATTGPAAWDDNLPNNSLTLTLTNEQEGKAFNAVKLFHFTDANSKATANDFTAAVGWGDGSGNTSNDGSGNVVIVANPNGGFDVFGSHTYSEAGNYGTTVVVNGTDGTQYNNGSLNPTSSTTNQPLTNALLYHFTDATIPLVNTPNVSGSGGSLPAGTYYYTVTSTRAMGESRSSNEVSATTTGGNGQVTLNWEPVQGATGYKVYRGASPGAENTLIATLTSGSILSFKDDGSEATTSASPPSANILTASVNWGDGSSNASGDGNVSVVADSNGGFNVYGSHSYAAAGSYGIAVTVNGSDGIQVNGGLAYNSTSATQELFIVADAPLTGALTPPPNATINQPIAKAVLFHFTDADPNGTPSDYVAKVTWGDGATNSSDDGSGNVSVVADLAGGFDVIGSHTYTQIVNPGTFAVQVNDGDGSSTSASDSNFQVLYSDQPLTAGALNVPTVTTEGQSIHNQVLFHFSDPDTNAQVSDYLASVIWGDGTFNSSSDNSGSVAVVANPNGGFDVVGSHVYGEGSGNYFSVKVTDLGDSRSTKPDRGGQFTGAASSMPLTITDPPVVVTAGPTFTASQNAPSTVQTIATFTDPGGPEPNATEPNLSPAPYLATIQWGDGTITVASLTAQANYTHASVNSAGQVVGQLVSVTNVGGIVLGSDGQTFSVNLAHQYAKGGSYTITTTLVHDGIASAPVSTQAAVADQVKATGGYSIQGQAGVNTGSQVVATFTDPGGAGPLADYSASINWGDGASGNQDISSGMISFNTATQVFTVSAAHTYANVGAYPITVVIENFNAFPATVSSTAAISPATPSLTVSDASGVYNGQPFPATGTALGIDGKTPVAGSFTYVYYAGSSAGGTPLFAVPVNAGVYTVVATFTSNDKNYVSGGTAQATFTISPATPTLSVTDSSGTYDGKSFTATGTALGVDGKTVVAGSFAYTYYSGSSASGTPLSSPPVNVGVYVVVATFTSSDANYTSGGTAQTTFTITPASLSATGVSINAIAGAPFSGVVATFTNADPLGNAASYTATITWGDGSTSNGVISGNGNTLTVSGSHTYAAAGNDTVQVVIQHKLGDTTTATVSDTAVVTSLGQRIHRGQTASIHFWHSKHGQALIDSFNGGPTSTALATWLATNFSNLYGAGAGANNLTGKSNAEVAAFYQSLFHRHGQNPEVDVLATALNVYATTLSLGGTAGQAYGFTVSADGLGADPFNVGRDGAAFGVPNHTTLNVYQLLLAVNEQAVNGDLYNGDAELLRQADYVFDALNRAGRRHR